MEIFHLLRSIQLPNGVTQSQAVYQDRFCKLQEHLRQLTLLFRKLRLLYEKCAEMTSDLDKLPTEMVPYINEDNQDEISTFQGSRESQEILEKVKQKNEGMKVLMDQMRQLLWDINSMLTLRK
ncbi:MED30 polymerase, partial [Polypterus senegalus]|nr:MED30 polymerase [Polypterus senegalus]